MTYKTICMCVDIRNSTNFHTKFNNMENATNVIADFISDIYQKVTKINPKFGEKFIYAGDGIMFIYQLNPNETKSSKIFKNFLQAADVVEEVILEYENDYQNEKFKAAIALDYGNCIEHNVKNIPQAKGKTPLYVGYPISRSTKICKSLPIEWKNKTRYIGLSFDFFRELEKFKENNNFKLTTTKKKAMKYE